MKKTKTLSVSPAQNPDHIPALIKGQSMIMQARYLKEQERATQTSVPSAKAPTPKR